MELLNLFPESRISWEQETIASSSPPLSNGVTASKSVSGSSSEKQSTAQLIILYNGAVKVYRVSADEAEAVLKLANSNSLSERATSKPSHGESQESKRALPMAKKLSLQRFLQKRKDRLGSLTPYDNKTSSKMGTEAEENEQQQIRLSLSFPSQRSG